MIASGIARAEGAGLAAAREALFTGEVVNPSEGRAATHVAERGAGSPEDVDLATARRQRTRALVDAIEADVFGPVTAVLHIGIGGSVLGPALLVDALGRRSAGPTVAFLSNIDGAAFDDAVAALDPATTLIVAASKTFTTAETLANLEAALGWLRAGGVDDPHGRVIAVTAAPDAALDFGIDESRILVFGEGVGGRYSLWSAVGVSAALALGWSAFEELLEGAAEMDRHFRFAEPGGNVPLIAAIADRFYVEQRDCQTRALFAYDERLRLLMPYLQQLEMESNGKGVRSDGAALAGPSAPVTWGGTGTDAQHAVFQLLHQGTVAGAGRVRRGGRGRRRAGPGSPPDAAAQCFRPGRGADDRTRERRCATILSRRPSKHDRAARPARRAQPRRADRLLRTPHLRQCRVDRRQSVRPVRGRAGQGYRAWIGRGDGQAELDASTRALIERAGV